MADKVPFRRVARQQSNVLPPVDFQEGQEVSVPFSQIGCLSGVTMRLRGYIRRAKTDTGSVKPTFADIVRRFRFDLNTGAASLLNVTGYGLAIAMFLFGFGMRLFGADLVSGNTDPQVFDINSTYIGGTTFSGPFVPQTGGGDAAVQIFPFNLQWYYPVALNEGSQWDLGQLVLQADELRANMQVQCGTLANDFFAAGSTLTGTFFSNAAGTAQNPRLEFEYHYFQLPNPDESDGPPNVFHRIVESSLDIVGVGDQVYEIQKSGLLLQAAQIIEINGTPIFNGHSDNAGTYWDNPRVVLNDQQELYRGTRFGKALRHRRLYGTQPPSALVHDFWNSGDVPNCGDFRDCIDTEQIAKVQLIFNVAETSTLGVGNNRQRIVRRILQRGN